MPPKTSIRLYSARCATPSCARAALSECILSALLEKEQPRRNPLLIAYGQIVKQIRPHLHHSATLIEIGGAVMAAIQLLIGHMGQMPLYDTPLLF